MNTKERSAEMENKDCEKILDLINQYIDGELNESDAKLVRAHIENCSSCKKAYLELLELEKLFEEAKDDAPAELFEAVMAKVREEKAVVTKRKKFAKIFGGVAVAAAISLTVLASPAILMVATGGAKANDMAEALSPSRGEADNYFSADAALPECETVIVNSSDDKSETYQEVMDAVEDVKENPEDKISDTTVVQGKKYTAYLLDGSETTLILMQDVAILGGKEFKYKVSESRYILTDSEETLIFKRVFECPDSKEFFFKQTEAAND